MPAASPPADQAGDGPRRRLASEIANELAALQAFIEALNDEQAALRGADADALPACTERKLQHMHRLNEATAARNAALAARGLPPDRDGLGRARQADATLADAIEGLLQRAAAAAEINRVNGRLISTQLQGTRDALRALGLGRGDDAGRLYAADARAQEATPLTGVRIIDSA